MSKLYISMYHYTRDLSHSRYPKIKGMDLGMFRQQIEFMKKNFNVVTMEQVIDAVDRGGYCQKERYCSLLMMDI